MDLTTTLSKNWSVLLVRGLIAIIFGVITWLAPNASLSIMLLFFAGYFLFDGMLRTWVAWNSKQHNPYWRWGVINHRRTSYPICTKRYRDTITLLCRCVGHSDWRC